MWVGGGGGEVGILVILSYICSQFVCLIFSYYHLGSVKGHRSGTT